jgi:hypothetical protein
LRCALLAAAIALAGRAGAAEPAPPADRARGLEDPDGGEAVDVALLLPRVALGIPRLAFRIATAPLVGLVHLEERYHVASWLEDLFYNDARTAAILPTLSFETFTGSSVGVTAFHDDLLGGGERLRFATRFGGTDDHAHEMSFSAGRVTAIGALARFERAPDLRFHGIGAGGPASRFAQDRLLGVLRGGRRLGPAFVTATAIYNHRRFRGGTIEERYDTATLTGYAGGVDTLELQAGVVYDSRVLRAEAFAGGVPAGARTLHVGAEAAVTLDLWAPDRRILLRAAVESVEGDDVPFTDLPRLGGAGRLRGYPLDRFRGTTALIGTAEYRYPVHQYLDGALFVDVGHVTGGDWPVGGGLGLVLHSRERVLFSADIAFGEGLSVVLSTDPLRAFARKDTEL